MARKRRKARPRTTDSSLTHVPRSNPAPAQSGKPDHDVKLGGIKASQEVRDRFRAQRRAMSRRGKGLQPHVQGQHMDEDDIEDMRITSKNTKRKKDKRKYLRNVVNMVHQMGGKQSDVRGLLQEELNHKDPMYRIQMERQLQNAENTVITRNVQKKDSREADVVRATNHRKRTPRPFTPLQLNVGKLLNSQPDTTPVAPPPVKVPTSGTITERMTQAVMCGDAGVRKVKRAMFTKTSLPTSLRSSLSALTMVERNALNSIMKERGYHLKNDTINWKQTYDQYFNSEEKAVLLMAYT